MVGDSKSSKVISASIDEVQQDLLAYLQQVEAGVTLQILKSGQVLAEMTPVNLPSQPLRPFGLCAGEFVVPDDFDAPLPEHILREFECQ